MEKINQVKNELLNSRFTCVISDGEKIVFTSEAKGVKPLMDYYKVPRRAKEIYIADRIVGKGAAMLAKLLNAQAVYTPIISEPALDYFQKNNVYIDYDKKVKHIINRTKDGRCPIELAVLEEEDVCEGYLKIQNKINQLMGKK